MAPFFQTQLYGAARVQSNRSWLVFKTFKKHLVYPTRGKNFVTRFVHGVYSKRPPVTQCLRVFVILLFCRAVCYGPNNNTSLAGFSSLSRKYFKRREHIRLVPKRPGLFCFSVSSTRLRRLQTETLVFAMFVFTQAIISVVRPWDAVRALFRAGCCGRVVCECRAYPCTGQSYETRCFRETTRVVTADGVTKRRITVTRRRRTGKTTWCPGPKSVGVRRVSVRVYIYIPAVAGRQLETRFSAARTGFFFNPIYTYSIITRAHVFFFLIKNTRPLCACAASSLYRTHVPIGWAGPSFMLYTYMFFVHDKIHTYITRVLYVPKPVHVPNPTARYVCMLGCLGYPKRREREREKKKSKTDKRIKYPTDGGGGGGRDNHRAACSRVCVCVFTPVAAMLKDRHTRRVDGVSFVDDFFFHLEFFTVDRTRPYSNRPCTVQSSGRRAFYRWFSRRRRRRRVFITRAAVCRPWILRFRPRLPRGLREIFVDEQKGNLYVVSELVRQVIRPSTVHNKNSLAWRSSRNHVEY